MYQAYQECQPIYTGTSNFKQVGNRHLIQLSNPRILNGGMILQLFIVTWNSDLKFFYDTNLIDSTIVKAHVLWKFSSDENYILNASAEMDISQKRYEDLNIRHWKCE